MPTTVEQPVLQYLESIGGRDYLEFEDPDAACAAAWKLREQLQDLPIKISSRYNKVWLHLQKT